MVKGHSGLPSYSLQLLFRPVKPVYKDVLPKCLFLLQLPLLAMVLHGEGPDPAGHAQVLTKGSLSSGKLCFPTGKVMKEAKGIIPEVKEM